MSTLLVIVFIALILSIVFHVLLPDDDFNP